MEFEYKFVKTENGDIEYCHTCACEAMVCEFDNPDLRARQEQRKVLLCEICSGTHIGSEIRINQEFISPFAFAQALNLVLNKIKELKDGNAKE